MVSFTGTEKVCVQREFAPRATKVWLEQRVMMMKRMMAYTEVDVSKRD